MSEAEAREPVEGDGYAVASLDGLGQGYGFRKIRRGLGVFVGRDGRLGDFVPATGTDPPSGGARA